jgi:glycoside/pentoside/hexuronide:cation symporter, GPH family
MHTDKPSFVEKAGYSAGDAAANFVFMTMILYQLNFYTDVFGLTASAAAAVLLWPRLFDAVNDPLIGVLADRTRSRWGRFRPWILWTAVPWAVVMVIAYTTPHGWSAAAMVTYAMVTNTVLMTLYSMNNMPYAALGGVITADLQERAKLNSYRFIAVNIAQLMVGGLTLPLVARFSEGRDRAFGWQATMSLWAVLCLVLFLITFLTTKERVRPVAEVRAPIRQDFRDLFRSVPWRVLAVMTLIHFAILSFRGGALYNYYHQFVDPSAMYDFLQALGLTRDPALGPRPGGLLDWLGYLVHAPREAAAASNTAAVFNSLINVTGTTTTILVIFASASLAARFGKKAIATAGFALSTVVSFSFYLLPPASVGGMFAFAILGSLVYAPTIPLLWAMFADVADHCELTTGRRFTGVVFATFCFCIKTGLALGSACFLWIMQGFFGYDTAHPGAPDAVEGYRFLASIGVGSLFAVCTILLACYGLNKTQTIAQARELERRRNATL